MPTKILAVETSTFQVGEKLAKIAEKVEPSAFPARVLQYCETCNSNPSSKNQLFVLAPRDKRELQIFADALKGPHTVSIAFFEQAEDALKILPSLPTFVNSQRTTGVKDCLAKGSTIFNESFFGWKGFGAKLDPAFALARQSFPIPQAVAAWNCLQSLLFFGLQQQPELGEKASGEKIDIQIGADEKNLVLNLRFDLPPEQAMALRFRAELSAARCGAHVFESRYLADAKKLEITCLFFRHESAWAVDILSYQRDTALDDTLVVKEYGFKPLASFMEASAAKPTAFKKSFSQQLQPAAPLAEPANEPANQPDKEMDELQGKIRSLENSRDREKEMIKLVDKAVQEKNETMKKFLELELKFNKAEIAASTKEEAATAKISQLERRFEEQKKEKSELEKLVGDLTLKIQKTKAA